MTKWGAGCALEQELFNSLSDAGVEELLNKAKVLHGAELVDQHIKSASEGKVSLYDIEVAFLMSEISAKHREVLGLAAKSKSSAWYKSVSTMEAVALEIVAPNLATAKPEFLKAVNAIFAWAENG